MSQVPNDGSGQVPNSPPGGGSAGGGLFNQVLSPTPTLLSTGFSQWYNQAGGVASDTKVGINLNIPVISSGASFSLFYKPAPATPYRARFYVTALIDSANFGGICCGFFDGTSKLQMIDISYGGENPSNALVQLSVDEFSNFGSYVATNYLSKTYVNIFPLWMELEDDGTNIYFKVSPDGDSYVPLYTVAKSAGYLGATGYANIGFGANTGSTSTLPFSVTLLSYRESSP